MPETLIESLIDAANDALRAVDLAGNERGTAARAEEKRGVVVDLQTLVFLDVLEGVHDELLIVERGRRCL